MSFGIWELVIILLIVALVFGTKKLKTIGGDLGGAIKGFRNAMKEDEPETLSQNNQKEAAGEVIEGEVENRDSKSSS